MEDLFRIKIRSARQNNETACFDSPLKISQTESARQCFILRSWCQGLKSEISGVVLKQLFCQGSMLDTATP